MSALAFTAFDVLVAVVLVLSVVVALVRGAVREIASLAAWAGAAVCAWYGFAPLRPVLKEAIGQPLLTDLATFAVVFVVPLVVLRMLGGLVVRRVEGSRFAALDRLFGLVYGLVRGAVLVSAAWLALLVVLDGAPLPGWIARAASRPYVESGARILHGLLPREIAREIRMQATRAAGRVRRAVEPVAGAYPPQADRALDGLIRRLAPGEER